MQSDKQEKGAESSENSAQTSVQASVQAAEAEVNTEPTQAQAEAGNYKKGHVTIGDFDITIENPAGSVRRGVDANGKPWETTDDRKSSKPHSFEVTEIEMLDQEPSISDGAQASTSNDVTTLGAAKLLKGVEKSYDNGVKYSANHSGKSTNIGVHAAVMDKLSEIIGESIEVMEHADVNKINGNRSEDYGYKDNTLMHRFVGAVNIDGIVYRVITTLKESSDITLSRAHTYEVTKIEVLDADTSSTSNATVAKRDAYLRTAKLLKGVEIHKKSGKKILEESRLADEKASQTRMRNGAAEATDIENAGERLIEIQRLKPIAVDENTMSKDELKATSNNLPNVIKNGRKIEFYHSAFKKIYKVGGLFGQMIPVLDKVLEQSVLAYSESDSYGGQVRPDGTVHKEHPNVESFDNYVAWKWRLWMIHPN